MAPVQSLRKVPVWRTKQAKFHYVQQKFLFLSDKCATKITRLQR